MNEWKPTVFVVDDEAPMRAALEANLLRDGWTVMTAAGVDEAMAKFRSAPCPLVITDMRMPDGDGLRVMQGVREIAPGTAVVFLTAFGSIPEAVLTMKEGACDYLMKPISFDQLSEAARRLLGHDESAPGEGVEHGIVGRSAAFRRMLARARHVASGGATGGAATRGGVDGRPPAAVPPGANKAAAERAPPPPPTPAGHAPAGPGRS